MQNKKFSVNPEELAYWYFRLNGFLTTVNFVVHPDGRGSQRTDADVLGIRFPYRAELYTDTMQDDELFTKVEDKPFIIIAEVKTSMCELNGPWTEPGRKNMQRVLRAIGLFPVELVETAANSIYETGVWEDNNYYLSLVCIGARKNNDKEYTEKYKAVPQVTWEHILGFIYDRFNKYRNQKADHDQWEKLAQELFRKVKSIRNKQKFIDSVIVRG